MGGQVHSVDRAPHTRNTLCNKEQGRDTGWVGSRHNRRHKQLRFFPIKSEFNQRTRKIPVHKNQFAAVVITFLRSLHSMENRFLQYSHFNQLDSDLQHCVAVVTRGEWL